MGAARLYLDGGDKAEISDLEKDDVVVVAFSGSPYKETASCSVTHSTGSVHPLC